MVVIISLNQVLSNSTNQQHPNKPFRMQIIKAVKQLNGNQNDSLKGKVIITRLKHILQVFAKQFNNNGIVVFPLAKPKHLGKAGDASYY